MPREYNKYAVIMHDDRPEANPEKITIDYIALSKEDARAFGEQTARSVWGDAPIAIEVEWRRGGYRDPADAASASAASG